MAAYSYLKRFSAGAVFGLYMAYLLYFLNPQLDTDVPRILLAGVCYSVIGGLVFGTLLWGLRWLRVRLIGRGDSTSRHGFGNMAAAATVSAIVYWLHLAMFRIYLPRGAIRLLSKATILIAAAAFLLFILWLLERNASRRTSRIIFASGVGIVLISAVLLYQRREGYRDTTPAVVYAEVNRVAAQRPIAVIALRGVAYDAVLTVIGEGLMPHVEAISRDGFAARVQPFRTSSPKAIWASLATGQLPHRHGVTGRFAYRTALTRGDERFTLLPSGIGFSGWGLIPPIERDSAPVPAGGSLAFWEIFERVNVGWTVVNWPGATARPSAHGTLVGERSVRGDRPEDVWPRQMRSGVAATPRSPLPANVRARIDALGGLPRRIVETNLASDLRAVELAFFAARVRPAPLSVISLNAYSEIAATVTPGTNTLPPRGTAAGDALRASLMLTDALIGRLRERNPAALVYVVSPSSPVAPPLPLNLLTLRHTLRDFVEPGQNDGFVLVGGEGVRSRPNPPGAAVVDVVPTILFSAGVPNARDFDGEVITDAFDDQFLRSHAATYIPTYQPDHFFVRR